ncbi:Na+/H+ antiporter NhaA [Actinoplanes couchii]|uniref:Na(+)/H(+) antiporter NhaA n=1 Tax=Actinoplanes couchii TaxID=403638 RepID=A0ABQ3XLY3_9ACTN|nr:Na+/H+ antiporter NhaA [Actinoplanes couchii]MDR6319274.1 NhaA family Na+:H+ antiporter [Actinoplanes couchii]GID59517.1 Na+/H+ antiporter [Actinoplanes couchii]
MSSSTLLRREDVSGALLVVTAFVAVLWANSPWAGGYQALRDYAWVADALLAVFFFVVGNELKQQFTHGDLRHPRRAVLPIVAACTGAVVPAIVFALITAGHGPAVTGWGIPMATDIAFAVAVLAVVGRGLPAALRTFLLTLAIVDDLIAIVVIAVFYAAGLSWAPLLGAIAGLIVFGLLQRRRRTLPLLIPLAVLIWYLVHAAGIHATVAGAAMGLLMRTRPLPGETGDPSHRAEHLLRPWTTAVVLPVFALTSAGVAFDGMAGLVTEPAAIGVFLGLVAGKTIGITGGAWLTTRLTRAELHPDLGWPDITGMATLAGIGFTVSLLIAALSYPDQPGLLEHAKGAILIASVTAAVLGGIILRWRGSRRNRAAPAG